MGPGVVEIHSIDFPKLALGNRKCEHGVILKIVSTNICGSDQHMARGRTTAPKGLILGHEITGEVIEAGRDVEFIKIGDLVSVPFNIACGRCRNCNERATGICLNVNPARPGAAYGYVDMGNWVGGQADYVMVPYADFNLLKFPDKEQAMAKIRDLTCLSDILPTGYHGAVSAGVGPGATTSRQAPARNWWLALSPALISAMQSLAALSRSWGPCAQTRSSAKPISEILRRRAKRQTLCSKPTWPRCSGSIRECFCRSDKRRKPTSFSRQSHSIRWSPLKSSRTQSRRLFRMRLITQQISKPRSHQPTTVQMLQ